MVGRGLKRLLKQDEFKYGLRPPSKHVLPKRGGPTIRNSQEFQFLLSIKSRECFLKGQDVQWTYEPLPKINRKGGACFVGKIKASLKEGIRLRQGKA